MVEKRKKDEKGSIAEQRRGTKQKETKKGEGEEDRNETGSEKKIK